MAQYEESQIEFAILSLVKDPLIDLVSDLAGNVRSLMAIQSRLDEIKADWRSSTTKGFDDSTRQQEPGFLTGPDAGLGLTEEHILTTPRTQQMKNQLAVASATEAMTMRKELITAQQGLRMALQEEIQSKHSEEERASARTRDFGAKMQKFARKVKATEVV